MNFLTLITSNAWDLSSAGRASALQAEGHRFEPCRSHFFKPMWLNWQSSWFVISRLSVRVRSSALYWEINTISYNWICDILDGFPSGQRGQTVNLLQIASVVRIHLHPLDSGNKRIETIWNDSKKVWIHLHPLSLKGDVNTIAGWSSLEARRAHNPEVIGSNPIPATRCVSIVPS